MEVTAISTSQKKHQKKLNTEKVILKENYGIIGDAHSDRRTNRQISLLGIESIQKMLYLGLKVKPGSFGENITTRGIDLPSLPVNTKLLVGGEVVLQITQIGKECLQPCAIGQQVGKCVMPTEGVFARVLKGGKVKVGDGIEIC